MSTTDVVAGFFSFTEITDPSAHLAYNEWHQLDHLPEQMPLAGIVCGQRWVISPRCREEPFYAAGDFARAHYVTLYLLSDPIDETIRDFFDLAVELRAEHRFFDERRAVASGAIRLSGANASARVRVSGAALPFRPNRGAYVFARLPGTVARVPFPSEELMTVPGVAGVYSFRSAEEEAGPWLGLDIDVFYLDDDPVVVAQTIAQAAESWRIELDGSLMFAGPVETIVAWSWDWFDV